MEWSTYLEHIGADAARLSHVARSGLEPDVPCCHGWTVRDLVGHLGMVYAHKVAVVDEGWDEYRKWRIEAPKDDLVDWFDETASDLLGMLSAHEPTESVWTFFAPDQTVGFWYRRIAHETLIHRIDGEQAHGSVSEIDRTLAADGVDEILTVMISESPSWATLELDDRFARLEIPGQAWTVQLGRWSGTSPNTDVEYTEVPALMLVDPGTSCRTVVTGTAEAMDRWLWGRGGLRDLAIQGDPADAAAIRAAAKEAT